MDSLRTRAPTASGFTVQRTKEKHHISGHYSTQHFLDVGFFILFSTQTGVSEKGLIPELKQEKV